MMPVNWTERPGPEQYEKQRLDENWTESAAFVWSLLL